MAVIPFNLTKEELRTLLHLVVNYRYTPFIKNYNDRKRLKKIHRKLADLKAVNEDGEASG